MSEWTEERINEQRDLAVAGRAGFWIVVEGGPRNATRGFVPHLDWPFRVVIDREGATWCFASPRGHMPIPAGATVVGSYVFDRDREIMRWEPSDGAPHDIPSVRRIEP